MSRDSSPTTSVSPTDINTWIKSAKDHSIETASSLHMLARDLRILAEDNKAVMTALRSELSLESRKETILELAKNIECMATDASQLSKEITERMGTHKWPEAMTAFREANKRNVK